MMLDEMELVGRLGDVEPLPSEVSERAKMVLRAAMAVDGDPDPVGSEAGRRPLRRRRSWLARLSPARLATAVAVPALAAVGILAATTGGPATHAPRSGSSPVGSYAISPTAGKVRLAGYTFRVPVSYQVSSDSSCGSMPSGVGSLVVVASTTNSGCIAVGFASGSAVSRPSGAQSIAVGPDKGYWSSPASGEIDLYVEVPSAQGHDDLVVTTTGRTLQQDVAVAESGLSQNGQWGLPDYQHLLPGAPIPPANAPGS